MKILLFGLAFVALAVGEQYLPPVQDLAKEEAKYLPPVSEPAKPEPSKEYLAPVEIKEQEPLSETEAPVSEAAPAAVQVAAPAAIDIIPKVEDSVQNSAVLADDGYHYKTIRRIRYRIRRDVNELASAKYLPPAQEDDSYSYSAPAPVNAAAPIPPVAPVEIAAPAPVEIEAPIQSPDSAPIQQSAELSDDGYRYKTIRRIRYRYRRDVNELPSVQYLPPAQEDDSYSYPAPAPVSAAAPIAPVAPVEISAPAPVEIEAPIKSPASAPIQQSAELSDDGYRYKTIRRIRYRHRRDVNELSSAQYLPPAQEDDSYSYPAPAPVNAAAPIAPVAAVEIAAPAPVEIEAPIQSPASAPIQQSAELSDEGYRYKTIRRIRYRHRRDVNELSSAQYLPPTQEEDDSYSYPAPAPVSVAADPSQVAPASSPIELKAPVEVSAPIQQSAELADDGYRYKTVRRIRFRHRRDVNELPASQYIPPAMQSDGYSYSASSPVQSPTAPKVPSVTLPLPLSAPLPLAAASPLQASAPPQESAELASDGYKYKTVKRFKIKRN